MMSRYYLLMNEFNEPNVEQISFLPLSLLSKKSNLFLPYNNLVGYAKRIVSAFAFV